jgi:carboxy-cis,cis-muconate cyclase
MVSSLAALAVILSARSFVQADLHHVFVPSFTSPHLYSLEFDDANNTIAQAGHIVGNDGHPWISFSYDKASLYAGETNGFASYTVDNSTSLSYKKSVPLPGSCSQKIAGFGATYVLPLQKAPFTVYGAPFGSCLSAMSVEPDGTLMTVVQNVTLDSGSGIHGLAMGPDAEFLYSADDSANGIWVHKINQETGAVTKVSFTPAPSVNAGPRHLIVHPTGRFLYVVMEAKNEVRVYAVNFGQRSSQEKITDTGLSYSLVPQGANPADYMATEVILSADSNILFASTRYRALRAQSLGDSASVRGPLSKEDVYHHKSRRSPVLQRRAPQTGYVTAILLVPQSEQSNPEFPQGAGFPLRQLFQTKTTTSGGMSNAVSPAPWDRNYFTISDTEIGQVEVRAPCSLSVSWLLIQFCRYGKSKAPKKTVPSTLDQLAKTQQPTKRVAGKTACGSKIPRSLRHQRHLPLIPAFQNL